MSHIRTVDLHLGASIVSVCAFILYARLCATAPNICDPFETSSKPSKTDIITLISQMWQLSRGKLQNGLRVHTAARTTKIQTFV